MMIILERDENIGVSRSDYPALPTGMRTHRSNPFE